ncbi:MAG: hypothetical protein Ct9H300mP7_6470 [Verrucomicrobiota bacterium]|nr:MAG: hypothetical protein Ct9H300mP7_6470 [Verrucomicrobiota bacterium]
MSGLIAVVFFGDLFALYYSGCWFALVAELLGGILENVRVCLPAADLWGRCCSAGWGIHLADHRIIFIVWPLTVCRATSAVLFPVNTASAMRGRFLRPQPRPRPRVIDSPNR